MFLCTHQLRYAQEICTRYGLIENGTLLAAGTLEELRRDVLSDTILQVHVEKMPVGLPFRKSGENQYEMDIRSDTEIPHLVRQIVEGGGEVYDVTAQKPSLEDIYFALTAKGRREAM